MSRASFRAASLVSAALSFGLAAAVAHGCGGQTGTDLGETRPDDEDVDAGGSAGSQPADAGKDAKKPKKDAAAGKGGTPGLDSSVEEDAADAFDEYVDPGCPDAGPPLEEYECDPYNPNSCGFELSCYPFVQYPTEPCGQEIYGSTCIVAGIGQQGDGCDEGCSAGHICVISGQGTQCIQMCNLKDLDPCEDGMVCASVDIPGIGGCI